MRLSDEQYEEIKQTVIDTFLEYDIRCIPINAFEMAIKMGLKIVPYSALDDEKKEAALKISSDGYSIETENNEWRIYYNDSCRNYGRVNQTVMHEIGHYALGHVGEGEVEESEAKFFAKYALAPPPLVHNMDEEINVNNIMRKFDISYKAAQFAHRYYWTWLRYGGNDYTNYELKMLELFKVA